MYQIVNSSQNYIHQIPFYFVNMENWDHLVEKPKFLQRSGQIRLQVLATGTSDMVNREIPLKIMMCHYEWRHPVFCGVSHGCHLNFSLGAIQAH